MPDIQAGDLELTQEEAAQTNRVKQDQVAQSAGTAQVDELGETHEESAAEHLGHS